MNLQEKQNDNLPDTKTQSIYRKTAVKFLISAGTIYIIMVFILTLFQRKIIYYPSRIDKRYEFPEYVKGLEEFFMTCEDGVQINGLFSPGKNNTPLILMFHGNAGNITHREFLIQGFSSLGYPTAVIDYHGFGKSGGSPSEKNFYRDGEAVLSWLKDNKNIQSTDIIIFAKSIGSGVGCEMALRHPFRGLILETPFASTPAVAASHFPYSIMPTGLLIADKFRNINKIPDITCPVLIIHGTRDSIIPVKNGKHLYEAAGEPKQLFLVEGAGHNNVQFTDPGKYWDTVKTWIEKISNT